MSLVPVRYRRVENARFLQKLQHAIPSVIVLTEGVSHLQHGPHGVSLALGVAEVAVSLLVIGTVIRGFRVLRTAVAPGRHAHHGIDWIDLTLGAMLLVEAYAKFHANGRLARPIILMGAVLIVVGIFHGRIAAWGGRRLELRVEDQGISVPGRFFRRLTLAWSEVAEITVGAATARVIALDGRDQQLNLADAINADAIRHALADARGRLDAHRAEVARADVNDEVTG